MICTVLVRLVKDQLTHLHHLGELNGLLGGALEVVDGEDLHSRVVDQLVSLLHVGALQSGDDGDLEVQGLDGLDQTVGNGVTADNTTEDVDEDGGNFGVASDQFESLLDGGGGSTATHVEEVGGLATVQLDDVHGSHGKTGTVDKAANVTVQLDEVKTRLRSTDFLRVLLGGVSPRENLLLSVVSVVIKTKLGVHAQDLVVRGLGQRVNLDLGSILLEEDLVQLLDGVLGILDALLAEAEAGSDIAGNLVSYSLVDVDVGGLDSIGVLLGDTLDIHTTLGGGYDNGALGASVHEDGQVELATGELALADVDGVAEAASRTSLLGHELMADHLVGEHLGLGRRVDDADTTLQAVVEGTLSSSTG